MINTNETWFKNRLKDIGATQRDLASHMGLDPSSVSLAIRGMRKFTLEEVNAVAKFLRAPLDEVIRHAGVDVKKDARHIVIGAVDSDGVVHKIQNSFSDAPIMPPGALGVVAHTSLTKAAMWDGYVFFVRPEQGVNVDSIGRICLIESLAGDLKMASIVKSTGDGEFLVTDVFAQNAPVKIKVRNASPVVAIKPY